MGIETGGRAGGNRHRDGVAELDSPVARLVCMYLERVPSAYAYEMEQDLQLSESVLDPALGSLLERGIVRERCGLYVLSVDGLR